MLLATADPPDLPQALPETQLLLVSNYSTNSILSYNAATGQFAGTFAEGGGLAGPGDLAFGPDGNLYVTSSESSAILRYDGDSGAPLPLAGNAGALFVEPIDLLYGTFITFGPDGLLYVSTDNGIQAFNTVTGELAKTLTVRGEAFAFAPNGDLLVSDGYGTIERLKEGLPPTVFTRIDSCEENPNGLAFGPDGDLYVAGTSASCGSVLEFDGISGAFLGEISEHDAYDLVFGSAGELFFSDVDTGGISRVQNGIETTFIPAESGGLDGDSYRFIALSPNRSGPQADIAMRSARLVGNEVQFTFETIGGVGSFPVRLFQSANARFDSDDSIDVPVGSPVVVTVAGGLESLSIALPEFAADPARPYLLLVADPPTEGTPNGSLAEANELNNSTVAATLADIVLKSAEAISATEIRVTFSTTHISEPFALIVAYSANTTFELNTDAISISPITITPVGGEETRVVKVPPLEADPAKPFLLGFVREPFNGITSVGIGG